MSKENQKTETNENKIIWPRVVAGILYFFLAFVFLSIFFKLGWTNWVRSLFNNPFIQWCLGWTCAGIGVGLINTRNHKVSSDLCHPCFNWILHYVGYYGFVLVVISFASVTVAFFGAKETWIDLANPRSYSLAALVGLVGGFLGYRLHDLISKFPFKNKETSE